MRSPQQIPGPQQIPPRMHRQPFGHAGPPPGLPQPIDPLAAAIYSRLAADAIDRAGEAKPDELRLIVAHARQAAKLFHEQPTDDEEQTDAQT